MQRRDFRQFVEPAEDNYARKTREVLSKQPAPIVSTRCLSSSLDQFAITILSSVPMLIPSQSQSNAKNILKLASILQRAASSATSSVGNYGLALDDPIVSTLDGFNLLERNLLA